LIEEEKRKILWFQWQKKFDEDLQNKSVYSTHFNYLMEASKEMENSVER
jgi:hypothetical protein